MYIAYIYNEFGRYHARIYLESDTDLMPFAMRYIDIAPRIMITNSNDESIFEAEGGDIQFPELAKDVIDTFKAKVEPLSEDTEIEDLMDRYLSLESEYRFSGAGDEDVYNEMISIENDMFAIAARDDINLPSLGWVNSGVIQAELEAQNS